MGCHHKIFDGVLSALWLLLLVPTAFVPTGCMATFAAVFTMEEKDFLDRDQERHDFGRPIPLELAVSYGDFKRDEEIAWLLSKSMAPTSPEVIKVGALARHYFDNALPRVFPKATVAGKREDDPFAYHLHIELGSVSHARFDKGTSARRRDYEPSGDGWILKKGTPVVATVGFRARLSSPDGETLYSAERVGEGSRPWSLGVYSARPFTIAVLEAGHGLLEDLAGWTGAEGLVVQQRTAEREHRLRNTAPSELALLVAFDDASALIPNSALDAGDSGSLEVDVANHGQGIAFEVYLEIACADGSISTDMPEGLGDIGPNGKRTIEIPVRGALDLSSGEAKINLRAKEKRGYDSKAVEVVLATRALVPPKLVFDAVKVEDRTAGLTQGNGNGVPENGETVEVVCLVKNEGRGAALDTRVALECDEDRFGLEQGQDEIGEIGPGKTGRAVLRFRVPRTDSGAPMEFKVAARDGRGASEAGDTLRFAPSVLQPVLTAAHRVQGTPANGERFMLAVAVRNEGTLAAENVRLAVNSKAPGIRFTENTQDLGSVDAGEERDVRNIAIEVPRDYAKSIVTLDVALEQDQFPGWSRTVDVSLDPRAVDLVAELKQRGEVRQGDALNLVLGIRNRGTLEARNVEVRLSSPSGHMKWLGDTGPFALGAIAPGAESKTFTSRLMVKRAAEPGELPVVVQLSQADFADAQQEIPIAILSEQAAQVVVQAEAQAAGRPTVQTPAGQQFNQPPSVMVFHPRNGERLTADSVALRGRVWDDRGLDHIAVTVNGVQIGDRNIDIVRTEEATGVFQDFTRPVFLQPGENTIRVEAFDTENLRAEETVTLEYLAPEKAVWIVAIGVDDYEHNNIPDLRFAESDARAFADYMRDEAGVPADHVEVLCGPAANLRDVQSTLGTQLRRKARPEDTAIIYYSGHGAPEQDANDPDGDGLEKYLLPYDAEPEDLFATAISMGQVARIFGRLRAERVVFIADTCYSGASGGRTLPKPGRRGQLSSDFLERISRGKGRVILTASGANQLSREDPKLKHGIFTYYLLEGLQGKADDDGDGYVTVQEIYAYVSERVRAKTQGEQHPVWKGEVQIPIVLGRVSGR